MYILHTGWRTGGFAVHALLEEAGADYRIAYVDTAKNAHRTDAFLRISPLGQVPVLELPDGSTMTESAAMMIYLADSVGHGRFGPTVDSPARPHFLRWMFYMSANIYMTDLRVYYSGRYSTDPSDAAAIKEAAVHEMDTQFDIINREIGTKRALIDDKYSAADIYLAMLAHWHPDVSVLLARCPGIAQVCKMVKARPAAARTNELHKLW